MMPSCDTSGSPSHRAELEHQLRRLLRSAARKIVRLDGMVARRLGIHATDLASMDLLNSAESPVTPKVLSEHLGISTGSATAAIDRLERAGYTRRVPNPSDRRGVILEPTNHQQEKLSAAYKHFNQQYEELIRDVPDDELEAVIRFLGGIWARAALDQSGKMPKAVGNIAFCV